MRKCFLVVLLSVAACVWIAIAGGHIRGHFESLRTGVASDTYRQHFHNQLTEQTQRLLLSNDLDVIGIMQLLLDHSTTTSTATKQKMKTCDIPWTAHVQCGGVGGGVVVLEEILVTEFKFLYLACCEMEMVATIGHQKHELAASGR
eukprot:c4721_g1_i2.p1 GENE.c4721_g1_i2~~c4721_g1_i2.p1  ORF type:complete len:159 (-),score=44.63 c4721_g1_i2:33-470(-)